MIAAKNHIIPFLPGRLWEKMLFPNGKTNGRMKANEEPCAFNNDKKTNRPSFILPRKELISLPYSHTPILPYSHTPILPYSHTPILPYSHTPLGERKN